MTKTCSFCLRENLDCEGIRATGSYRDIGSFDVSRPKVFNGYICDFHIDNVEWVSLKVAGKYLYRNNRRIKSILDLKGK